MYQAGKERKSAEQRAAHLTELDDLFTKDILRNLKAFGQA